MKKLTQRRRNWFRMRARRQAKFSARRMPVGGLKWGSHSVKIWDGAGEETIISEQPARSIPSKLCFTDNLAETASWFAAMRRRFLSGDYQKKVWVRRVKNGRLRSIRTYADFSVLREISTAAALVMAAEYDRVRGLIGSVPPAVDIHKWDGRILKKLLDLGFFETVGLQPEKVEPFVWADETLMTQRFFSGRNTEDIGDAHENLRRLWSFLEPEQLMPKDVSVNLMSAISEAMSNVARHAYPPDAGLLYPHVGKWWMAGEADRRTRSLRMVIFDQGATIPVTYRKQTLTGEAISLIESARDANHRFAKDGRIIEAAARFGASSTEESKHGNGMEQMKRAIDIAGAGRLRILSRGGEYIYEGGRERSNAHQNSVGGTLIEWEVQLPAE
ncbi:hypothetical protein [Maricaulis sp.]|uniref:hypothetical protein n=1 Tax=Maricaulis sp. TaxID=1486257 RepID=UPI003A93EC89